MFSLIKNTLFPKLCLGCKKYINEKELYLCNLCNRKIEKTYGLILDVKNFQLTSAVKYNNETIKSLIHLFKYKNKKTALIPIEKLIRNHLEEINLSFKDWIIIPIPIHAKKERIRGFNQSRLIAKSIQEIIQEKEGYARTSILDSKSLIRTVNTENQARLSNQKERAENIKNCFEVINKSSIKNKNIILVDDVFTSGATVTEAVKTLRANGANKVLAFVVAKT